MNTNTEEEDEHLNSQAEPSATKTGEHDANQSPPEESEREPSHAPDSGGVPREEPRSRKRRRRRYEEPLFPDDVLAKAREPLPDGFIEKRIEELPSRFPEADSQPGEDDPPAEDRQSVEERQPSEGVQSSEEPSRGRETRRPSGSEPAAGGSDDPDRARRFGIDLWRDPVDEERPMVSSAFLAATFAVAGGLLPNVRIWYDRSRKALNLFVLIIAESGAGKGILSLVREIGKAAAEYPGQIMSPNASGKALTNALAEDPHRVLFSEECQSLLTPLKGKWGNYEEALLSSFHQEKIELHRTDESLLEVQNPAPSFVVGGQPEEAEDLFSSTQDGLRARVMMLSFEGADRWVPKWGRSSEKKMSFEARRLARVLGRARRELSQRETPLILEPTPEAGRVLNGSHDRIFERWIRRDVGTPFTSSLKRSGLQAARVAAILTVVRAAKNRTDLREPDVLEVEAGATERGVELALLGLAAEIKLFIDRDLAGDDTADPADELSGKAKELYDALEDTLDIEEAMRVGLHRLGMTQTQLRDHLQRFRNMGLLHSQENGPDLKGGAYELSEARAAVRREMTRLRPSGDSRGA